MDDTMKDIRVEVENTGKAGEAVLLLWVDCNIIVPDLIVIK